MQKEMAKKWEFSSFRQPTEWLKGNVIGSGSFGNVHLAIDTSTGALFVAKSTKSEAGIRSFKNEANILENLESPHIIKCIGRETSLAENGDKKYSLFFEYMAGGSLSDVAQKFGGILNEKIIRLYTREILQGLNYLHKNRIVHCDIKCKNVLLSPSGDIKLADFGCAKKLSHDHQKNSSNYGNNRIGGTPLWMAPEVLRNEGLDFAADIWSLGCTVIEMATGRVPWGGNAENINPMAAVLKIAKGNGLPDFPRHFSAEGLDFLAKCLERDPRKRWTSEMLLAHPFVGPVSSRLSKEEGFSPTSVLDVASYGDDDDDDDEFMSRKNVAFSSLGKCCCLREKFLLPKHESDFSILESSDNNWITVRTS